MHIEIHGELIRLKYLNNEKSELKKQKKNKCSIHIRVMKCL